MANEETNIIEYKAGYNNVTRILLWEMITAGLKKRFDSMSKHQWKMLKRSLSKHQSKTTWKEEIALADGKPKVQYKVLDEKDMQDVHLDYSYKPRGFF